MAYSFRYLSAAIGWYSHEMYNILWKIFIISRILNTFNSYNRKHFVLTPTYAHLEQILPLSYSFVGDLPDDGSAKAETYRRHIIKKQMIVCCYLCNCWIKCYIYFSSSHFKNIRLEFHSMTIILCLLSPCLLGYYTSEKRLVSIFWTKQSKTTGPERGCCTLLQSVSNHLPVDTT
jgi:hypothetical protein